MTYRATGLSAISYANGFTFWHYKSADSIREMASAGYFDEAHKMLRVGDFICVNANIDSTRPENGILFVFGKEDSRVATGLGFKASS